MKRVLICVPFSLEVKHARVALEEKILVEQGCEVDLFSGKDSVSTSWWVKVLNILTLKYFEWGHVFEMAKKAKAYDVVLFYNLKLLPLTLLNSGKDRRMVYQTLDHNVSYHFYELAKRLSPLSIFKPAIVNVFSFFERRLSQKADAVMVNSFPLGEYLSGAIVNLYSSPFEGLSLGSNSKNPFALIYFGKLSKEKGAEESVHLAESLKIPLFYFGRLGDQSTEKLVKNSPWVKYQGNFEIDALGLEIQKLSSSYNLLGVSLIHSIHLSYEIQEANKDIDYLALGIPIVGNRRRPTFEKIEMGCGVLMEDVEQLFDFQAYRKASRKALKLYQEVYAQDNFKNHLLKAVLGKGSL